MAGENKSSQKMRNGLKRICMYMTFFAIFSFWDMVDFVLNIRSELGTYFANLIPKR